MEENKFDISEIADEISCEVADAVESAIDGAIGEALRAALPEALRECFAQLMSPKQRTMVLSNDKTKYICCCGGLRINGTTLMIQTDYSSWDRFCYATKEEAKENLLKIKKAMDEGLSSIEL